MPHDPELQDSPADNIIEAGICNLRVMYKCGQLSFPVCLTLTVRTNLRGVHMSRLVGAVLRNGQGGAIEDTLRSICRDVNRTQKGCVVKCEFQYPVGDQFMGVSVKVEESGPIKYAFSKDGIAACPCSKKTCGIAHMQRATLRLSLSSLQIIDFRDVSKKLDSCFSASLTEHLKRDEEAAKILDAQNAPRFVEDLVRECLKLFPQANRIEAQSYESIHSHDAIAYWDRARAKLL
uniref:GTP cyclohydrolase I FolE2 n=1 Tax=Candidatus Methanomethylicus mesodigestus TaxID=1867258 RepID=A0A7C3IT03_9CREN